jgi:hypothetical protein
MTRPQPEGNSVVKFWLAMQYSLKAVRTAVQLYSRTATGVAGIYSRYVVAPAIPARFREEKVIAKSSRNEANSGLRVLVVKKLNINKQIGSS